MSEISKRCQVVVIGGGPSGATAAALLAEAGLSVLIIEKDRHPRFHIGESLLPETMPLLNRLGIYERTRAIGVFKPGAEFVSEDGSLLSRFHFKRALHGGHGSAYQVARADFDKLVFDRARELGAETWEETMATVVSCEPGEAVIDARGPDGVTRRVAADFLIDASGRSTVMSSRSGEKDRDPNNDSAAIFGHFSGIARDSDADAGNIRIYFVPDGWVWRIPLQDGRISLGLVASSEKIGARTSSLEEFFRAEASKNAALAKLLETAEPVGRMTATGNFSYYSRRAGDAGHIKVGDAFGFLDPIFSTGVHFAMTSAFEASDVVLKSLDAPRRRTRLIARYEAGIRRRMGYAAWFIYRIRNQTLRHLLLNPQNPLGVERAVISLLAGNFTPDWRIRFRVAIFKTIWWLMQTSNGLRGKHEAG